MWGSGLPADEGILGFRLSKDPQYQWSLGARLPSSTPLVNYAEHAPPPDISYRDHLQYDQGIDASRVAYYHHVSTRRGFGSNRRAQEESRVQARQDWLFNMPISVGFPLSTSSCHFPLSVDSPDPWALLTCALGAIDARSASRTRFPTAEHACA